MKKRKDKAPRRAQPSELEAALAAPMTARKGRKKRGPKRKDPLKCSRAAGFVTRRTDTVLTSRVPLKRLAPVPQTVFETGQTLDYDNFVAQYSARFNEGSGFWLNWICSSVALTGSLSSVIEDLKSQPDFADFEMDTPLVNRILRYHMAHTLCLHLGIETERALAGTSSRDRTPHDDISRLLQLLSFSRMPQS